MATNANEILLWLLEQIKSEADLMRELTSKEKKNMAGHKKKCIAGGDSPGIIESKTAITRKCFRYSQDKTIDVSDTAKEFKEKFSREATGSLEKLKEKKILLDWKDDGTWFLVSLPKDFDTLYKKYKKIFSHDIESVKSGASKEIFVCKKLNFNLNSGDAFYNGVRINFKPDMDEYKLLKGLIEKPNERFSYAQINELLGETENSKKNRSDIAFIIRNIKNKLGIGTKNKKGNKNLFKACNGYKIIC